MNLVGSLPGNEILILILLPFLAINHGERAFRREYLWVYILLGGWLFGTIGGDLYLGTSVASKLKGIARVVFLGLDFAALAVLINRKTRGFIVFLLADAVLLFLGAQKFGGGGDILTEWKYGLGGTVLTSPIRYMASKPISSAVEDTRSPFSSLLVWPRST